MRKALLATISLIVVTTVSYPKDETYDRELALAAGKAYVEAYWRVHPELHNTTLAWDRARVVEVATPDEAAQEGVIGVFFPETSGSGVGFACFVAAGGPDHLIPTAWGQSGNLERAIKSFNAHARTARCITDDGFF